MPNNRLNQAAREGDIHELHQLLREDPRLLDKVDEAPFTDTPLHIAARHGMAEFAMEIAILKPAFTRKLNPDGFSPMHEALHAQQWTTIRSLMMLDAELIRVKGTGGKTPLHVAAEVAPKQLLAEFLFVCPSSILDVTARWETAVHIAIRNENIDSFKVLFGWLIRVHRKYVLNWKDINGDTALHLATGANWKEAVEMLVKYVSIYAMNFEGKTALDIHTEQTTRSQKEEIKRMLQGDKNGLIRKLAALPYRPVSLGKYYSSGLYGIEKWLRCFGFRPIDTGEQKSQKSRDVVLLVAVLIATAAYQAILTPPGGYWQDNSGSGATMYMNNAGTNTTSGSIWQAHYAGQLIMHGPSLFSFIAFNSLAFCFSLAAIVTNIVELKQRFMLNSATLVLLLTYSCTLIVNLNQGQDKSLSWSDWRRFRPLSVIPLITLIIGFCYIGIGTIVALSKFYERLMDSQQRNIRHLVGCDETHFGGSASSLSLLTIFCCKRSYV